MTTIHDHLRALRDKRGRVAAEQVRFVDDCHHRHPGAGFTAEERQRLDRYDDELHDLDAEIGVTEERAIREADSAAERYAFEQRYGRASSSPLDNALGTALRQACALVMEGRSSVAIDLERRAMETSGTAGNAVPIQLASPVMTLRAKSAVLGLPGLREITMTSDRTRFPRVGAVTAAGAAESAVLPESDADVDGVDIVATKFGVLEYISTELVEDMAASALTVFGENLLEALARRVDYGLLEGFGNLDCVGIRNVAGANATAQGGVPTNFAKYRDAIYEAEVDNAAPNVWLMHPRTWRVLSSIKTGLASDETTLLEPNPQVAPKTLLGLPVATSTQITLTEGGTSAGSWAAALDTAQLIVGIRRPATLEVSRDFRFDRDQIAIRATWRGGLAALNPEGVSLVTDIRVA